MSHRQRPRLLLPLLLALVGPLAAGCPAGSLRTGRPLSQGRIASIRPATTTKAELFALLGAPMAIVGPGEYAAVPSVTVRADVHASGGSGFLYGDSYPLQGNALLELFAEGGPPGDPRRVYHWIAGRERGWFFVFPIFAGLQSYTMHVDELYILVNEETERVEGVVFRPAR